LSSDSENLDRTIEHICRLCLFSNPKPDATIVAQALNSCSILTDNAILGITQSLEKCSAQPADATFTSSHVSFLYP
jgi:hypothetical protein